MWKPEVILPISTRNEALKLTEPMFETYALGWDVKDYRGAKIVSHGGAVLGFQSVVVLVPDKNVGFAIEINSEDGEIALGLMYELLDHYLGFPENELAGEVRSVQTGPAGGRGEGARCVSAKPAKVGPSLPLARYAGVYADPWYGNIEVAVQGKSLAIDFKSTPRHGRSPRALAIRHVHHALRGHDDRACVRDLRPGRGRSRRARDAEAGLAAGGFQLRLRGPVVHARRGRGGMSKTSHRGTDSVETDRVEKDESGKTTAGRRVRDSVPTTVSSHPPQAYS